MLVIKAVCLGNPHCAQCNDENVSRGGIET